MRCDCDCDLSQQATLLAGSFSQWAVHAFQRYDSDILSHRFILVGIVVRNIIKKSHSSTV